MSSMHPWLGAVAAGTQIGRVKHGLASLQAGGTPDTGNPEFWSDQGTPWVAISDMSGTDHVVTTAKRVTAAGLADKRLVPLEPGALLYSMYASLGHVAELGMPAVTNQAILGLRFNLKLRPRYAFWQLKALQPFVVESASSNTQDNLNAEKVRNLPFAFPEACDQERIANFLDEKTARIDALIAEKERLAFSIKDIEEVTAFDMVTRGLATNVARKAYSEPWLPEVPVHWGLSKLRHVATVGNGSTPKRDNDRYWIGGETPWLNSGSVNATRISEASDFVTDLAKEECHLPMVRPGSTVVALTGQGKTRGAASLTEIETTINQHLAYLSLFDSRVSDEYLWVVMTGMYSVLRYLSDGEGSTKGALTCEQLNQLRVPIPPRDEQANIVQAYKLRTQTIEALANNVTEHISLLREYRSSLISAAVTGQLDIHKAS